MKVSAKSAKLGSVLLEALHSAWIDVLNARCPKLKPELGMPRKKLGLEPPAPGPLDTVFARVTLSDGSGPDTLSALLALNEAAAKTLGGSTQELWGGLLKQARGEFSRRKIEPRFEVGPPQPLGQVIWIPFGLEGHGQCYLGVGM
jgi:hypothetical protein